MKEYSADAIRNIALVGGHGDREKTSLAEACLFSAGARRGSDGLKRGTPFSDYHADEIERQISINSSLLHCEWKNCKTQYSGYSGVH